MSGLARRPRGALAAMVSMFMAGALSAGFVAVAHAQTAQTKDAPAAAAKPAAGAPVIVVIDAERVGRESLAGKSINTEAQKYDKSFTEDNRKDEAPLHTAEQELQKLRGTIPAEQFAEKARAFEQKMNELQRTEFKRRQAFEKSLNAATSKLREAVLEAAHDVALAHNADAVVQSQALLFYNTAWDVTNEVIDLMNKRVSKVDFPPPKIEPDVPPVAGAAAQDPSLAKPPPKQLQQAQPQLKLPEQ